MGDDTKSLWFSNDGPGSIPGFGANFSDLARPSSVVKVVIKKTWSSS